MHVQEIIPLETDVARLMEHVVLLDFIALIKLVSLTPTKELALPLIHVYPSENSLASTQLANICMESENLALPTLSAITKTVLMELVKDPLTMDLATLL